MNYEANSNETKEVRPKSFKELTEAAELKRSINYLKKLQSEGVEKVDRSMPNSPPHYESPEYWIDFDSRFYERAISGFSPSDLEKVEALANLDSDPNYSELLKENHELHDKVRKAEGNLARSSKKIDDFLDGYYKSHGITHPNRSHGKFDSLELKAHSRRQILDDEK